MKKIYLTLLFAMCLVVNQYAQTTTFDFESGNIDNWGKLNPAQGIDITQEEKHGGTYAMKMVNGTGTNAYSLQVQMPDIPLTNGHTYKFTFWVKVAGGLNGQGRISMVEGTDVNLGTNRYWNSFTIAASSEWQQITYNNLSAGGSSVKLTLDMGYIANRTYYIDDIVIEDLSGGETQPGDGPLAKNRSKFLGNIIANSVPSSFNNYWNQVTPENASKWSSIQPSSQTGWSWTALDRAYNHAKTNGYKFKFHTFVWGSQEPSWLKATTLSDAERLTALKNFMAAVASRYKDIDFIDVVNEPFHETPSTKAALGGAGTTGWDWIVKSFEMAREYFPNAKLHINEYGIIGNPNQAREYVKIISILKDRNLIDGIGIQCHHFNMNPASVTTIKNVLDILAATGLPIYASELDMNGTNGGNNEAGTEEIQYQNYKNKFPVLWEHEGVAGVTLWGYIYGLTWRLGTGLIESNGTERKAMIWLKEYMASEASNVPNKFETTGTNDISLANYLEIYPNPATNYFSIIGENIARIDMYDISGKLVMTSTKSDNINIKHLENGLYLLRVETNGKIVPLKLLKK